MVEQGSGNTRSLFIGINYVGTDVALKACHHNVTRMKEYIMTHVSCGVSINNTPSSCLRFANT